MDLAIEAALKHQNYEEVARLIARLASDDLWGRLYQAKLHEAQAQWDTAETLYRDLLRQGSAPKLALEARQGLQRLAERQKAQQQAQVAERQAQVSAATAQPGQSETGVLVLEPLPTEQKAEAAVALARIMQIDPYSARLLIPSRGWRLYRTGPIGELQVYGQELNAAGVLTFWQSLQHIQQIKVHEVSYLETTQDPVRLMVTEAHSVDAPHPFTFEWSAVSQLVFGQLPIFEEVVDLDARGVLKRKEQTQDYAQFCDLHLPNCILRFYDVAYQFNHGVPLTDASAEVAGTSWANWRGLTTLWQNRLPNVHQWEDFSAFADTVIDQIDVLERLDAHINLFRREESYWDQAFHLYSGLAFLKSKGQ